MASYRMKPNGRSAQILWRFGGAQLSRTIRCAHEREAQRACSLVEETLQDIGRGRLAVPPGVDPGDFVFSGGRVAAPADPGAGRKGPAGPATLDDLSPRRGSWSRSTSASCSSRPRPGHSSRGTSGRARRTSRRGRR